MVNLKQAKINEEEANEVVRLRVPVVYTAIKQEGEDELSRPAQSLWWSGIAAGLAIFLSVLVTATLCHYLDTSVEENPIVHLGYAVGFIVVILGRLQLFTENTITAVIPVLSHPTRKNVWLMGKLWLIVFLANMVGVAIAAASVLYGQIVSPEIVSAVMELSHHYVHRTPHEFFVQGIPAGFIVAALVWMMPSAHGYEFWVILMMTYLISLMGLTHVVAGAGEIFAVVMEGEMSLYDAVFGAILPTFGGNVLGGTALFSLLAYAQVREEI